MGRKLNILAKLIGLMIYFVAFDTTFQTLNKPLVTKVIPLITSSVPS